MQSLASIGEFGFINRISQQGLIRPDGVVKGIGDDAAAFRTAGEMLTLVTTDLLVERVHFVRHAASGFQLGHKAMAVNLSDIAAMGGMAREAFVSIAIPEDCSLEYLDDLYRGMHDLCSRFGVNILGGDTTGSKQDLIINVALTGEVSEEEILCRDGARPGDLICIIGYLGNSRAGLHLITNNLSHSTTEYNLLYHDHLTPWPRLTEGRFLAASGAVTAALDVSDGLSSDLGHLCTASQTGARVHAASLPISWELAAFCTEFGFEPVDWSLAGGEDYALLFTVRPESLSNLRREYERRFDSPMTVIGEMTQDQNLVLVDGSGGEKPLPATGWNHFTPA